MRPTHPYEAITFSQLIIKTPLVQYLRQYLWLKNQVSVIHFRCQFDRVQLPPAVLASVNFTSTLWNTKVKGLVWKKWSEVVFFVSFQRQKKCNYDWKVIGQNIYLFRRLSDIKNIKLMAISSISSACFLLFMTAITGCILAEVLRIERDSSLQTDDFLLPSSQCPGGQPQCRKFNGSVLASCWCTCNDIQSQRTGFFEPSYGCTQVSSVRRQAGMTTISRQLRNYSTMTRAWDKEKIWVSDGNRTHGLPDTGWAL